MRGARRRYRPHRGRRRSPAGNLERFGTAGQNLQDFLNEIDLEATGKCTPCLKADMLSSCTKGTSPHSDAAKLYDIMTPVTLSDGFVHPLVQHTKAGARRYACITQDGTLWDGDVRKNTKLHSCLFVGEKRISANDLDRLERACVSLATEQSSDIPNIQEFPTVQRTLQVFWEAHWTDHTQMYGKR